MKLISSDFDRSHSKLKLLLEGKFEDHCDLETAEAMSKLAEAIERVDQEMKLLRGALQGSETIPQLNLRIKTALERKETSIEVVTSEKLSISTPLKNGGNGANFEVEDFPSTPTLEQLGLSGPTLSIVGRRVGFDSSASMSDGEFDNSFYQKSPMATGVDNSFSSDVSVPNFRIFNSSPAIEPRATTMVRGKSHNLKQVTTVSSVLVDFSGEDSSIIADEEPPAKKVHFSENVENQIPNN